MNQKLEKPKEVGDLEKAYVRDMQREDYLTLRIYTSKEVGKNTGELLYTLVIFRGRAKKPYVNYLFRSEENMQKYIQEQKEATKAQLDDKKQQQEERKNFKHTLKVGDILYTSWGYGQTNIDYYQVTELVGKKMVKLKQIKKGIVSSEMTADNVIAIKDKFYEDGEYRGGTLTKKVQVGNGIRISSFEYATLWDGQAKSETNPLFGH